MDIRGGKSPCFLADNLSSFLILLLAPTRSRLLSLCTPTPEMGTRRKMCGIEFFVLQVLLPFY